ncbi:hypothetical protein L6452_43371 [Arctium lappa]|uniref:Uncharacterized protein n=1 Tax=Arctium lappa TaxID=4217 RepID=A0ACB8XLM2_ARCLA|nr:hypothetical protein L6452_43371 [Arctium lappa]
MKSPSIDHCLLQSIPSSRLWAHRLHHLVLQSTPSSFSPRFQVSSLKLSISRFLNLNPKSNSEAGPSKIGGAEDQFFERGMISGTNGSSILYVKSGKVRGIGEYTVGAMASIAFNEAVPVVDGNIKFYVLANALVVA